MEKIFTIARWEFAQRLKDKSFQISLILIPLIALSINFAFRYFNKTDVETTKIIGVLDYTGNYFDLVRNEFSDRKINSEAPQFLITRISDEKRKAFPGEKMLAATIVIDSKGQKTNAEIISKFGLTPGEIRLIKSRLKNVFLEYSVAHNFGQHIAANTLYNYSITSQIDDSQTVQNDKYLSEFLSSFIFVLLFIMLVLLTGTSFTRSLMMEKTTRLIEILLSSCSPRQILFGKLFGISLTGFFQMLVWGLIGFLFLSDNQLVLSLQHHTLLKLMYFVLGYLLYASVFVGLGAAVNSDTQAQQYTGILSLLLLCPIVLSTLILSPGNSALGQALIYFPFTSAPSMLIKISATNASASEIIASTAILVVSITAIIALSSKFLSKGLVNFARNKQSKS